jgi:hypothetical protein
MVHFNKILIACLALMITLSCEPDDPPQVESYPENKSEMVGTWRYDSVMINTVYFQNADSRMIPGYDITGMGGLRSQLDRRMINYLPNGNYQLIWDDRGDYQLGVEDKDSWQPDFGYWTYDATNMTLQHNSSMSYEQDYTILMINDNLMVRKYFRRMSQSSSVYGPGGLWFENQFVEYYEYFSREEQSRF